MNNTAIPLRASPRGAVSPEDHVPTKATRATVERLSGLGVPPAQIAARVRCTLSQLNDCYAVELLSGAARTSEVVGAALLAAVQDGSVPAAVWWSKARMGWSERAEVAVEGGDKPIVTEIVRRIIDPKKDPQD